jgi:hypothetical protein
MIDLKNMLIFTLAAGACKGKCVDEEAASGCESASRLTAAPAYAAATDTLTIAGLTTLACDRGIVAVELLPESGIRVPTVAGAGGYASGWSAVVSGAVLWGETCDAQVVEDPTACGCHTVTVQLTDARMESTTSELEVCSGDLRAQRAASVTIGLHAESDRPEVVPDDGKAPIQVSVCADAATVGAAVKLAVTSEGKLTADGSALANSVQGTLRRDSPLGEEGMDSCFVAWLTATAAREVWLSATVGSSTVRRRVDVVAGPLVFGPTTAVTEGPWKGVVFADGGLARCAVRPGEASATFSGGAAVLTPTVTEFEQGLELVVGAAEGKLILSCEDSFGRSDDHEITVAVPADPPTEPPTGPTAMAISVHPAAGLRPLLAADGRAPLEVRACDASSAAAEGAIVTLGVSDGATLSVPGQSEQDSVDVAMVTVDGGLCGSAWLAADPAVDSGVVYVTAAAEGAYAWSSVEVAAGPTVLGPATGLTGAVWSGTVIAKGGLSRCEIAEGDASFTDGGGVVWTPAASLVDVQPVSVDLGASAGSVALRCVDLFGQVGADVPIEVTAPL